MILWLKKNLKFYLHLFCLTYKHKRKLLRLRNLTRSNSILRAACQIETTFLGILKPIFTARSKYHNLVGNRYHHGFEALSSFLFDFGWYDLVWNVIGICLSFKIDWCLKHFQYSCKKITTSSNFPSKLKWLFLKFLPSDHDLTNSNSF